MSESTRTRVVERARRSVPAPGQEAVREPLEVGDPDPVAPESLQPTPPPPRRRGVPRLGVLAVLAVLVAVVGFFGPVADLWYASRQRARSADLDASRGTVAPGQGLAVLQAPKIGLNVVVTEGTSPARLRGGPGHRPGTPLPGAAGNSVVYGHAGAWGGPFSRVSELVPGDRIVAAVRGGPPVVFVVTTNAVGGGGDRAALAASDDVRLTIVTGAGSRWRMVSAVSGEVGRLGAAPTRGAGPSRQSPLASLPLVVGLWGAAALTWGRRLLLRSHASGVVAIALLPVAAASLVGLLLTLDLALSPLR